MIMTEITAIRIDYTPCRGVQMYPHDSRTIRLMQPAKVTQGVLMSTFIPPIPKQLDNLHNKEHYGPIGTHQSLMRVNRLKKSWPKCRYASEIFSLPYHYITHVVRMENA
jgi:hypothetical protein